MELSFRNSGRFSEASFVLYLTEKVRSLNLENLVHVNPNKCATVPSRKKKD